MLLCSGWSGGSHSPKDAACGARPPRDWRTWPHTRQASEAAPLLSGLPGCSRSAGSLWLQLLASVLQNQNDSRGWKPEGASVAICGRALFSVQVTPWEKVAVQSNHVVGTLHRFRVQGVPVSWE